MDRSNPVDIFDREFKLGQVIAYPVRHGSYMGMNHGTIVDIVEVPNLYQHGKPKTKLKINCRTRKWGTHPPEYVFKIVTLECWNRAVIVETL